MVNHKREESLGWHRLTFRLTGSLAGDAHVAGESAVFGHGVSTRLDAGQLRGGRTQQVRLLWRDTEARTLTLQAPGVLHAGLLPGVVGGGRAEGTENLERGGEAGMKETLLSNDSNLISFTQCENN